RSQMMLPWRFCLVGAHVAYNGVNGYFQERCLKSHTCSKLFLFILCCETHVFKSNTSSFKQKRCKQTPVCQRFLCSSGKKKTKTICASPFIIILLTSTFFLCLSRSTSSLSFLRRIL